MSEIYRGILSIFNTFQFESTFFNAVIGTIISLIFFILFKVHFKIKNFKIRHYFGIVTLVFFQISILFCLINWIKFSLYLPSSPLALDNIFKLGWAGFLTFLTHIVFTGAYWILGVDTNKYILVLIPKQKNRIFLYFSISIFAIIPFYFSSLNIPLIGIFLFVLCIFLIYDLYLEGQYASLTWTLTWILFFAFFHTQLLYKFTLEREWKEMFLLSEKLSKLEDEKLVAETELLKKDKISIAELKKISKDWENGYLSSIEYQTKIEETLQLSPYISTFYKVSFLLNKGNKSSISKGKFFLSRDYKLSYLINPDNETAILFTLKSEESKRLSNLMAGNYKGIENLSDYSVAIYHKNRSIFNKGNQTFNSQEIVGNFNQFQIQKQLSAKEMNYSSTYKSGLRIIIGKRLGGYAKPLSFFSFTACISLCLYFIYTLIDQISKNRFHLNRSIHFKSFGSSIQKALFYLTFSSFCILSITTLFYFNRSRKLENEKRKWDLAQEIISTFQSRFHGSESQLASISKQHGFDLIYVDGLKVPLKSYLFEIPGNKPGLLIKEYPRVKKEEITWKGKDLLRIWYPVPSSEGKVDKAWLGIYFPNDEKNLSNEAVDFIGALFSGYLFLLLSISALTIYITHSLTNPLDQLGKHLSRLKIDTSEKITWSKNDEVGQLVNAYNTALDALWDSSERLRKTERENAWREMAKQVAHEIKNPLTPMKLSLQYLQRAGKIQPEIIHTLLPNLTVTMMEQINTLDHIASAFSQFASMPGPENSIFNLVELTELTIEMYRHQIDKENCFKCHFQESFYPVFADKHQIQRVLNNLLNNAFQAIPSEKEGQINIRLFQADHQKVRLEIEDNGIGVAKEAQQKIFTPTFTTKSSGTGLGLAMCKDIVENAGGKIGFHSTKNENTIFWIEMPLSVKDNSQHNIPSMAFAS